MDVVNTIVMNKKFNIVSIKLPKEDQELLNIPEYRQVLKEYPNLAFEVYNLVNGWNYYNHLPASLTVQHQLTYIKLSLNEVIQYLYEKLSLRVVTENLDYIHRHSNVYEIDGKMYRL